MTSFSISLICSNLTLLTNFLYAYFYIWSLLSYSYLLLSLVVLIAFCQHTLKQLISLHLLFDYNKEDRKRFQTIPILEDLKQFFHFFSFLDIDDNSQYLCKFQSFWCSIYEKNKLTGVTNEKYFRQIIVYSSKHYNHKYIIIMGSCITQSKKSIQKENETHKVVGKIFEPQNELLNEKKYGIKNEKSQKILKFQCSPLINNQFLYNKFHHDSNRPDELNLQWQIDKVEYDNNIIKVSLINQVPVNLWLVIGGKEKKTMTELYLQIQNYTECHFLTITTSCKQVIANTYEMQLTKKLRNEQKIRLILQSVSNPKQNLNLINTYSIQMSAIKLERQQMMWNNLAFQVETIFNQNHQFLNENLSQIECVICNEQLSTCILIPCKHMCLCRNCLSSFRRIYKACPLCKKEFTQIVVYKDVKN